MFVCSKPLQVLNCASIVRSLGIADGRLYVTTSSISDAEGFRRFVESSRYTGLFSTRPGSFSLPATSAVMLSAISG